MTTHSADAGTEDLRQEVDRARHDLGETVEALAAKADVKAMARERVDLARTRARDAAVSARAAASSPQGAARVRQGGAAAAAGGTAAVLLAVWLRRRRAPAVRVRARRVQRAPVKVRRTGAGRTDRAPIARVTGARRSRPGTPFAWTRR